MGFEKRNWVNKRRKEGRGGGSEEQPRMCGKGTKINFFPKEKRKEKKIEGFRSRGVVGKML